MRKADKEKALINVYKRWLRNIRDEIQKQQSIRVSDLNHCGWYPENDNMDKVLFMYHMSEYVLRHINYYLCVKGDELNHIKLGNIFWFIRDHGVQSDFLDKYKAKLAKFYPSNK